jgi:predicted RNA binding protein with dsRBD fold (UPF0201 family)
MAGGAVESAASNDHFIDREEFLRELQLREAIRKIIFSSNKKQQMLQEKQEKILRKAIRNLISEAETETTPHASTAINFLEDLLKKILPTIEKDYKSLTTKKEQRDSFRAQLVSSVESDLSTADLNADAAGDAASEGGSDEFIDIEEEIEIDITDDDKFIDIEGDSGNEEDVEELEDPLADAVADTGSKLAAQSFDSIEKQISETYSTLNDEEDQQTFKDYLVTNLKLYFDKWEKELSDVIEPTTDEYEAEKEEDESEEASAEVAGEEELEL